jgi:putative GTP pyrophosphokinase
MDIDALRFHLAQQASKHEALLNYARQIIESSLSRQSIQHLPVLGRLKSIDSACRKAELKGYSDPRSDMTDIVGLRVVVLVESDVERTLRAINDLFSVDVDNSTDKKSLLGPREFGYLSVHIVCSLGSARYEIPEYEGLCDIRFEIQLRTALQHAWAEIEHKKNYKGESTLPPNLERRLNAVSAEFSEVSKLVDEYKLSLKNLDADIDTDAITKVALEELLSQALIQEGLSGGLMNSSREAEEEVLKELIRFGVTDVRSVRSLLQKEVSKRALTEFARISGRRFRPGIYFYRIIMIANDAAKYFKDCRSSNFKSLTERSISTLESALPNVDIRKIAQTHGIEIVSTRWTDIPYNQDSVLIPRRRR